MAKIQKNGVQHYIGFYDTVQEASDAYLEAAKKLHGGFASK
jgi:hypothetical protein